MRVNLSTGLVGNKRDVSFFELIANGNLLRTFGFALATFGAEVGALLAVGHPSVTALGVLPHSVDPAEVVLFEDAGNIHGVFAGQAIPAASAV